MNLKKAILALICAICLLPTIAQSSFEGQPKAFFKALNKAGINDLSTIKEVKLPEWNSSLPSIQGNFYQIEAENVSQYKYIYAGRVNSCRAGGCSVTNHTIENANSEYFDYFILFDKNKTVKQVTVYNYQATHGQEVTAKGWLKQFIGHDGSKRLEVDKNIDSISGATISVYALTIDVEMKTELLAKLR